MLFDTKEYNVTAQYRSKKRLIKTFKQLAEMLDCIKGDLDGVHADSVGIGHQCKKELIEKTTQARELMTGCLENVFWTVRLEEVVDNPSSHRLSVEGAEKMKSEYKEE